MAKVNKKAQQSRQNLALKANRKSGCVRKITQSAVDLVHSYIRTLDANDPSIAAANRILLDAAQLHVIDPEQFPTTSLNPNAVLRDTSVTEYEQAALIDTGLQGESDAEKWKRFQALVSLDGDDEDELQPDDPVMGFVKANRDLFHKIPDDLRPQCHAFVCKRLGITVEELRHTLHATTLRKDTSEIFRRPTLVQKKHFRSVEELGKIIRDRNRVRVEAEHRNVKRRRIYESIMIFYMMQPSEEASETE
ncbi:hypothetical protein J8273_1512 [Carpediemonas membranifera]|uniref:Uncharacterized protein n=1 Tax=Carpediemonas membranifera TaxID=201153 RepID=A0A8J6B8M3_9EUKA|nr:hypothetical protein J8273_1512 [Carpediemonas membranifera]|eukprot:KAG9396514.1 hypothetical protein J8273_1512 [Carpediemonas membranifera]